MSCLFVAIDENPKLPPIRRHFEAAEAFVRCGDWDVH